ncbi:hypothetical protein FOZ60_005159 [Perkinsus olseni]|uniref:Uncharacterized protein n=1 Tax=Perkinsus olseni TaxID=32597 RepID=A0A7J6PGG2_PEROL|nr:hypothetical protein FOZ60_005159 [Perkinsus olseni]
MHDGAEVSGAHLKLPWFSRIFSRASPGPECCLALLDAFTAERDTLGRRDSRPRERLVTLLNTLGEHLATSLDEYGKIKAAAATEKGEVSGQGQEVAGVRKVKKTLLGRLMAATNSEQARSALMEVERSLSRWEAVTDLDDLWTKSVIAKLASFVAYIAAYSSQENDEGHTPYFDPPKSTLNSIKTDERLSTCKGRVIEVARRFLEDNPYLSAVVDTELRGSGVFLSGKPLDEAPWGSTVGEDCALMRRSLLAEVSFFASILWWELPRKCLEKNRIHSGVDRTPTQKDAVFAREFVFFEVEVEQHVKPFPWQTDADFHAFLDEEKARCASTRPEVHRTPPRLAQRRAQILQPGLGYLTASHVHASGATSLRITADIMSIPGLVEKTAQLCRDLVWLDLSGCGIGYGELAGICDSIPAGKLQVVDLSKNKLDDRCSPLLCSLTHSLLGSLRVLNLADNPGLTGITAASLAKCIDGARSSEQDTPNDVVEVACSNGSGRAKPRQLEFIDFTGCGVDEESIQEELDQALGSSGKKLPAYRRHQNDVQPPRYPSKIPVEAIKRHIQEVFQREDDASASSDKTRKRLLLLRGTAERHPMLNMREKGT